LPLLSNRSGRNPLHPIRNLKAQPLPVRQRSQILILILSPATPPLNEL
jgi:hypothetical protein